MRDRMHRGRSDRSAEGVKRFLTAYRFGRCVYMYRKEVRRAPVEPPYARGERPNFLLPRDRVCVPFYQRADCLPPPTPREGRCGPSPHARAQGSRGGLGVRTVPRPLLRGGGWGLIPHAPRRGGIGRLMLYLCGSVFLHNITLFIYWMSKHR